MEDTDAGLDLLQTLTTENAIAETLIVCHRLLNALGEQQASEKLIRLEASIRDAVRGQVQLRRKYSNDNANAIRRKLR